MRAFLRVLILLLATFSTALAKPSEMERRLQEQERQIARLETENSQLRWLIHRRGIEIDDPSLIRPDKSPTPATNNRTDRSHVVQKGESLSEIARKADTTAEQLAALNNIKDPGLLQIGQRIQLPHTERRLASKAPAPSKPKPASRAMATHLVTPGETLYRISINYGMTLDQLYLENPGVDPKSLQVGQVIRVTPPSMQATEGTTQKDAPFS